MDREELERLGAEAAVTILRPGAGPDDLDYELIRAVLDVVLPAYDAMRDAKDPHGSTRGSDAGTVGSDGTLTAPHPYTVDVILLMTDKFLRWLALPFLRRLDAEAFLSDCQAELLDLRGKEGGS